MISRRGLLLGVSVTAIASAAYKNPQTLFAGNVIGFDLGPNERTSVWVVKWGVDSIQAMDAIEYWRDKVPFDFPTHL